MNGRVLERLEFPKLIRILNKHCISGLGRELVEQLCPSTDREKILCWQRETTEAKSLIRQRAHLFLNGLNDPRAYLRRVEIGADLEPAQLLEIGEVFGVARRTQKYFMDLKGVFPILSEYAVDLPVFPELEKEIKKSLRGNEVLDEASVELARLRRRIRELQLNIRKRLDGILRNSVLQKYLQEPIITTRAGRYVLPVKQEYRVQFRGIVHDQSASGATLFMEPFSMVDLNNELSTAELSEKREVMRVLRTLTAKVEACLEEIKITLAVLARFDFVFAKAKLSEEMDAGEPGITETEILKIKAGRHPFLKADEVVPVDVCLGDNFDVLVITGPNTGGKTVTLKMVGLFVLMNQSGLHIPAGSGTEFPVFRQIFADIGDEQSIEQSLSTFSSHMSNIVDILKRADRDSLVLLDELGAGTDPAEGASLGMAILEHLLNTRVRTLASTHFSELKVFAYNHPRVENASVEFDDRSLEPTYRLLIGVPGRSNAFIIASRLGMYPYLLERAREFLGSEKVQVADLIQNLQENEQVSKTQRREAEKIRQKVENLKEELEQQKQVVKEEEVQILEKAHREAAIIIRTASEEAKKALAKIRKEYTAVVEKEQLRAAEQAQKHLHQVRDRLDEQIEKQRQVSAAGVPPVELFPGDWVKIPRLNQKGQVLTGPDQEGKVQVQSGILKLNLDIKELRLSNKQEESFQTKVAAAHIVSAKARSISPEKDFRGLTVEEAIQEVDKYLDDAYLAGLNRVNLIHGKGTGALSTAVKRYLDHHPQVKKYRFGFSEEGGTGVTVVDLKTG